jgi:outer membrane biosynthesis protein TonB
MIAVSLDNLLFLLLVAVAVLFQFLAKMAAKSGKDQTKRTATPRTPTPLQRSPTESDEDRIRKLLEALGQPPTSRPPPPVAPRTDIPPRPVAPVQPPISPLSQVRREKARKREIIPKEIPSPRTVRETEKMVPPVFEVQEGQLPIAPPPTFKAPAETYAEVMQTIAKAEGLRADVATLLASTSRLRGAIILREILGPPRGLLTLEFIGT